MKKSHCFRKYLMLIFGLLMFTATTSTANAFITAGPQALLLGAWNSPFNHFFFTQLPNGNLAVTIGNWGEAELRLTSSGQFYAGEIHGVTVHVEAGNATNPYLDRSTPSYTWPRSRLTRTYNSAAQVESLINAGVVHSAQQFYGGVYFVIDGSFTFLSVSPRDACSAEIALFNAGYLKGINYC